MKVSIFLPDLESILLEIIFHTPIGTFRLSLFIQKPLFYGLFIVGELFLDVHSQE